FVWRLVRQIQWRESPLRLRKRPIVQASTPYVISPQYTFTHHRSDATSPDDSKHKTCQTSGSRCGRFFPSRPFPVYGTRFRLTPVTNLEKLRFLCTLKSYKKLMSHPPEGEGR